MTEPETPWGDLARIGAVTLGMFIGFGALLPIFPLWVETKGASLTDIGLVTTFAAGLGLVAGRPVAARMMEGRTRLPTLLAGCLICMAAVLLLPFEDHLGVIFATRVLQGLGFGMLTTAGLAAITDLAPPSKRGEVLGYYGASNALSLIIGPVLGGLAAKAWGYEATFYLAAALGVLPLLALLGLREPTKPPVSGRMRIRDALLIPRLRSIVGAHFFALLAHGALIAFLPQRMESHGGWMTVELFYVIDGAVLIVFRLAVGKRFDSMGRAPFIFAGAVFMAVAVTLLAFCASDATWALAAVCYGLGFGAYLPAASALVGDVVPETHRARGFALFLLALDLAIASGGLVFGLVADGAGVAVALATAAGAPLIAVAIHLAWRPTRAPG